MENKKKATNNTPRVAGTYMDWGVGIRKLGTMKHNADPQIFIC